MCATSLADSEPFCSVDTGDWPLPAALWGLSIVSRRGRVICKPAHSSAVVLTRRVSYGDGDYEACGSFLLCGQGRPAAKTNLYAKVSVIRILVGRFQGEGVAEGSHRCRSGQEVVGGRSWDDIRCRATQSYHLAAVGEFLCGHFG